MRTFERNTTRSQGPVNLFESLNFPDDCLREVFRFVDICEPVLLSRVLRVCKHWHFVFEKTETWYLIFLDTYVKEIWQGALKLRLGDGEEEHQMASIYEVFRNDPKIDYKESTKPLVRAIKDRRKYCQDPLLDFVMKNTPERKGIGGKDTGYRRKNDIIALLERIAVGFNSFSHHSNCPMKMTFQVSFPFQVYEDNSRSTKLVQGEMNGINHGDEKTQILNIYENGRATDVRPIIDIARVRAMDDLCQFSKAEYNAVRQCFEPFVITPSHNKLNQLHLQDKQEIVDGGLMAIVCEEGDPKGILRPFKTVAKDLLSKENVFDLVARTPVIHSIYLDNEKALQKHLAKEKLSVFVRNEVERIEGGQEYRALKERISYLPKDSFGRPVSQSHDDSRALQRYTQLRNQRDEVKNLLSNFKERIKANVSIKHRLSKMKQSNLELDKCIQTHKEKLKLEIKEIKDKIEHYQRKIGRYEKKRRKQEKISILKKKIKKKKEKKKAAKKVAESDIRKVKTKKKKLEEKMQYFEEECKDKRNFKNFLVSNHVFLEVEEVTMKIVEELEIGKDFDDIVENGQCCYFPFLTKSAASAFDDEEEEQEDHSSKSSGSLFRPPDEFDGNRSEDIMDEDEDEPLVPILLLGTVFRRADDGHPSAKGGFSEKFKNENVGSTSLMFVSDTDSLDTHALNSLVIDSEKADVFHTTMLPCGSDSDKYQDKIIHIEFLSVDFFNQIVERPSPITLFQHLQELGVMTGNCINLIKQKGGILLVVISSLTYQVDWKGHLLCYKQLSELYSPYTLVTKSERREFLQVFSIEELFNNLDLLYREGFLRGDSNTVYLKSVNVFQRLPDLSLHGKTRIVGAEIKHEVFYGGAENIGLKGKIIEIYKEANIVPDSTAATRKNPLSFGHKHREAYEKKRLETGKKIVELVKKKKREYEERAGRSGIKDEDRKKLEKKIFICNRIMDFHENVYDNLDKIFEILNQDKHAKNDPKYRAHEPNCIRKEFFEFEFIKEEIIPLLKSLEESIKASVQDSETEGYYTGYLLGAFLFYVIKWFGNRTCNRKTEYLNQMLNRATRKSSRWGGRSRKNPVMIPDARVTMTSFEDIDAMDIDTGPTHMPNDVPLTRMLDTLVSNMAKIRRKQRILGQNRRARRKKKMLN